MAGKKAVGVEVFGVAAKGVLEGGKVVDLERNDAGGSDSLEQLRGTAGSRQVTVRAETALAGCNTPDSCGFMMFSKSPN